MTVDDNTIRYCVQCFFFCDSPSKVGSTILALLYKVSVFGLSVCQFAYLAETELTKTEEGLFSFAWKFEFSCLGSWCKCEADTIGKGRKKENIFLLVDIYSCRLKGAEQLRFCFSHAKREIGIVVVSMQASVDLYLTSHHPTVTPTASHFHCITPTRLAVNMALMQQYSISKSVVAIWWRLSDPRI